MICIWPGKWKVDSTATGADDDDDDKDVLDNFCMQNSEFQLLQMHSPFYCVPSTN